MGAWEKELTAAVKLNNITKIKEILDKLSARKIKKKDKWNYKESPLHEAVEAGKIDILKLLLEYGLNPDR